MTRNEQIEEYAKKQGWSWPLEVWQYRRAAIAVRPMRHKVVDAAKAVESRIATRRKGRRVPDDVIAANQKTCENCPDKLFARLRNGEPVCTGCQCHDKYLEAKWADRKQKCPRKHWDNTKVKLTIDGETHGG